MRFVPSNNGRQRWVNGTSRRGASSRTGRATKVNAALFRMSDRIGTVEPGKYADLIVVAGDPLRNLRVFQIQDNLKVIMKGGHAYKQTL